MPRGESKRSKCFSLFSQGKRPSDPEVKELGIPKRVTYVYFQEFKNKLKREMEKAGDGAGSDSAEGEGAAGEGAAGEGVSSVVVEGMSKGELSGKKQSTILVPKASTIQGSVRTTIMPKAFSMSSTLLWQAMNAAINEWGWPADMSPEMFLDAYLYISFKQRGIILGGYSVIKDTEKEGGNGHNSEGDVYI